MAADACVSKETLLGVACAYLPWLLVVGSPEKSSHRVALTLGVGFGGCWPGCESTRFRGTGIWLASLLPILPG